MTMHYAATVDQFQKLPPSDMNAERVLVGSLMICDNDPIAFSSVRAIVCREAFSDSANQILFDALCEMHDAGVSIDVITIRDNLQNKNLYEEVGGLDAMKNWMDIPSWLHYAHYAKIVCAKWKWRELISICNEACRAAYAPHEGPDGIESADTQLTETSTKIVRVAQAGKIDAIHDIADVIPEVLAMRTTGDVRRVKTGLKGIDDATGGLGFGLKHLIAALQYVGKSALIKYFMSALAEQGVPVGVISIEEDRQKITANLLSMHSGVTNNRIQFATAGPQEWDAIEKAGAELAGLPIKIVDSARKLSAVMAMARLLAVKEGCRAIFVDHDHIIEARTEKGRSREQEISKISGDLKWLWRELDVIGVEACQLNRGLGRDRPNMEHLRDSGSLAQDADVVMMLHREDFWRKGEAGYVCDNIMEVWLRKVKAGGSAMVPLLYDDHCYSIRDAEPPPIDTQGMFQ